MAVLCCRSVDQRAARVSIIIRSCYLAYPPHLPSRIFVLFGRARASLFRCVLYDRHPTYVSASCCLMHWNEIDRINNAGLEERIKNIFCFRSAESLCCYCSARIRSADVCVSQVLISEQQTATAISWHLLRNWFRCCCRCCRVTHLSRFSHSKYSQLVCVRSVCMCVCACEHANQTCYGQLVLGKNLNYTFASRTATQRAIFSQFFYDVV